MWGRGKVLWRRSEHPRSTLTKPGLSLHLPGGDAASTPRSTLTKPVLSLHLPGPAQFSLVQCSRSVVSDSATAWTAARQASLSITRSRSSLTLMSIESAMPSDHLTLCHLLCSRSAQNCCAYRPTSFAFFSETLHFPFCPLFQTSLSSPAM